jgi:hypothetical protein
LPPRAIWLSISIISRSTNVKAKILMIGVVGLALAPSLASAQAVPPGNGYINGQGYNHLNSGNAFGQPNQSCQDINGGDTGPFYPGNTSNAPGSAFNETNGNAGSRYAGNAPQNSRNTASVSQYDVACSNQQPL